MICIQCKNCDRTFPYHLSSRKEFNSVITSFVLHSVFQNVGLLWIIDKNKHYSLEIDLEDTKCTDRSHWYNTTICTKLNGQTFGYYLKTVQKDRYDLMCSVDAHYKEHVTMTSYVGSGVGRPISITSSKKELQSLGHTINFLDNWLQLFDINDQNRISIYKVI